MLRIGFGIVSILDSCVVLGRVGVRFSPVCRLQGDAHVCDVGDGFQVKLGGQNVMKYFMILFM